MAIAIVPEKRWPYVLKADRDKPVEQQTTFHLKALSRREMAVVLSTIGNDKPVHAQQAAMELGIAGWDNYPHPETGAPIPFETKDGKPDPANLEWIPFDLWDELSTAIIKRNELTEEDRKNSSSPAS